MERLNRHMVLELAREFDVAVVGPRGCRQFLADRIAISEIASAPLLLFFVEALASSLAAARRFVPDIVIAGSGLAAPFAWCAARLAGARLAIYVHGLDLIADHPVYRWFWRPVIRRADLCIANSRNTANLACSIGVIRSRIEIVHPGVDLPEPGLAAPSDFRDRFGIGTRPFLLSVGRLVARKGLLEFVERAFPRIAERYPEVRLVVLGDQAPNLLHGSSAGLSARVRDRAVALRLEDNLRFIGPQDDATLAQAYRAADVHVFPVLEVRGDVEGFGMVAIEAAAHGLATVAFATGGVLDAVEDGVSGDLVSSGDYDQFASRVIDRLDGRGRLEERDRARNFASRFGRSEFGNKLRKLLRTYAATSDASR
jgi:phosphatidylinositol alpha-1,6-mannosyltransferase